MSLMSRLIRRIIRATGFELIRIDHDRRGLNPFADMKYFLTPVAQPMVFDIGGNVGQSIDRFRRAFANPVIHTFEPSPSTFAKLRHHTEGIPGVHCWNYGIGSANTTLTLVENDHSDMSSFLAPSSAAWGSVARHTDVPVVTLDAFAKQQRIEFIHVLKSDTQGFDFEVFKGAQELMRNGRIGLIYFEFIFSAMYEGLPDFAEVFNFLEDRNFSPVAFYDQHFQNDLLGWMDVLFISRSFKRSAATSAAV